MAGFTNPQPRKKNALSEYKLRLTGLKEGQMTKPPSLSVSIVKNQVHLDVYTNIPQEKNNGRITAKMSSPVFWALLATMRKLIDGSLTRTVDVECDGHKFYNGQRSEKKTLNKVRIGLNKDGIMYIAVLEDGFTAIQFQFLDDAYHRLRYVDNGQQVEADFASKLYAEGWVNLISELATDILVEEYVEPEQRQQNGNGSGNNNWNKGNQGNGNSYGNKSGGNNNWKDKGNNQSSGNDWGGASEPSGDSGDGDFPSNW